MLHNSFGKLSFCGLNSPAQLPSLRYTDNLLFWYSGLRTAESLNDWGARYDADIKELEYKLLGINTKGVVARNYETIVRKVTNTRRYGLRRVNWGKMITRIYT
jgi:hypothetical protein